MRINQILVWECPDCYELFKDKGLYDKHLSIEEDNKIKAQEEATIKAQTNELITNPRLVARTWDEYASMLEANLKKLDYNIVNLQFHDLIYGDQSNSHSAPIGKPTNWWGNEKDKEGHPIATHYKGWRGHVTFEGQLNWNFRYLNTGLNTGNGGGGSRGYRYSVTLWEDDFPLIKKERELEEEWLEFVNNETTVRVRENKDIKGWTQLIENEQKQLAALRAKMQPIEQEIIRVNGLINEQIGVINKEVAGGRQSWKRRKIDSKG